jgi:maleylacetoacetate isomerase
VKLYSYFRSSAAYRVRIALNLKGLEYDAIPVHLLKQGGEQLTPAYRKVNPQALVPALVDGAADELHITQSLAIMEYLDETHPQPPLLPPAAADRAYVRGIALAIACEIHPLNNLRVLRYLKHALHVSDDDKDAWYRHWCTQGLAEVEAMVASDARTGVFCCGDTPTIADCCLVPQIGNALRMNCDLSAMPTIMRIRDACLALDAFIKAAPENQPDAEP